MSSTKTVSVVPIIKHDNDYYMLLLLNNDKKACFYGNDEFTDDNDKYKCAAVGLYRDSNRLMVVKDPKDLEKDTEFSYETGNSTKKYCYKKINEGKVGEAHYIILQDMNGLRIMNSKNNGIMKKHLQDGKDFSIAYLHCKQYTDHQKAITGDKITLNHCYSNSIDKLHPQKLPEPYTIDGSCIKNIKR